MSRLNDDAFPEEYTEEENPVSNRFLSRSKFALRFGRYFLLLLLAVLLIGIILANREHISVDNFRRLVAKIDIGVSKSNGHTGDTIEFDYDEDGKVAVFKDGLVYLTPSKLKIMDNRGTEFFSVNTGFTQPEVLTTQRFVITFDRGGTRLLVTNSFAVVFEKTMEEPILTVSVNEKGYIAVITLSSRYKNTLHVFDNNFTEIFSWQSAERYLLDVAVSPDNNRIVLSCYNTKDGNNTAELVCIRTGKEEIYWTQTLAEGLPLEITFKNENTICLLQEQSLSYYNKEGKKTADFNLENRFIQQYSIRPEKYSVLVLSGSKRGNSTVCIINNNGEKTQEIVLEECVVDLSLSNNRIALLGEKNTFVCSASSSKILWQRENKGNIKNVCLGGKNDLFDIYATKAVYTDIQ